MSKTGIALLSCTMILCFEPWRTLLLWLYTLRMLYISPRLALHCSFLFVFLGFHMRPFFFLLKNILSSWEDGSVGSSAYHARMKTFAWIPRVHIYICLAWLPMSVTPTLEWGAGRDRRILGACWLSSWAQSVSFRFNKRPYLKRIRQSNGGGQVSPLDTWLQHGNAQMYLLHTCAHKYTYHSHSPFPHTW